MGTKKGNQDFPGPPSLVATDQPVNAGTTGSVGAVVVVVGADVVVVGIVVDVVVVGGVGSVCSS